jgi:hypothetical protein
LKNMPDHGGIRTYDLWNNNTRPGIFSSLPGVEHTQSNITQASYSPEYITPTQQISCKGID